jgi:hypothetical protein
MGTNMKIINVIALLACSFFATNSHANAIVNGDFATCDFTGWQQDTDFGAGSFGNDFEIVGAPTDCAAQLNVDYADTSAFFYNSIFQDLDLSVAAGSGLTLSFDWTFDGEEANYFPEDGRDYWQAAIGDGTGDLFGADGQLGFLYEGFDYDAQSFSADLNSSFFNQAGWSLEFQLLAGLDVNFLGSFLQIDNVQLNSFQLPSTSVPEPATLLLLPLGMMGLYLRRKRGATLAQA